MVFQLGDYSAFRDFLKKSLIILDDYCPGYTDYEQFANTGTAFIGKPVVAYMEKDFGKTYLEYLANESLSQNPLFFIEGNDISLGFESIIKDKRTIDSLRVVIEKKGLEYLQPFMLTKESVRLAGTLGLKSPRDISIIDKFNDKIYIKKIAEEENIPILKNHVATTISDAKELFYDLIKDNNSVIFKSGFACGGQGNFIINNKKDLEHLILTVFESKKPFVVEPLVDARQNPCTLYFLSPDKEFFYLGTTEQIIEGNSRCIGSIYPANITQKTHELLTSSSEKMINRISKESDYFGPLGFDFIIDENENPYFLEGNIRINYSHCMLDFLDGIGKKRGLLSDFTPKRKFNDMSKVLDYVGSHVLRKGRGGIFPFYPQRLGNNIAKFAAIIVDDNEAGLINKYDMFKDMLN